MKRNIPQVLYDQVFALINDIAQPEAGATGHIDNEKASAAQSKLRALYLEHETSGDVDPFLTEALADFTDDNVEAAKLHALALTQSGAFPGEPTLSKRVGMVRALIGSGQTAGVIEHIEIARREAFAERDSGALSELESFANTAQSGQS
jgi:hypothetical protein